MAEQVGEGIDFAMRLQALDEQGVDETMVEALHRAYGVADEVLKKGGPLVDFILKKRAAMIEAFKVLPDLRPTDVDSITRLQNAISQYLDPLAFLADAIRTVEQAPEIEGIDDTLPDDDVGDTDGFAEDGARG